MPSFPAARDRFRSPLATDQAEFLEALFAQCEQGLGSFLVQMLRNRETAQDVLQETWIVAHKTKLHQVEHPRAWLYGVARRVALKAMRSDRRRRFYEHQAATSEHVESHELGVLDAATVHQTLQRVLEPEDRALVVLRYLHGFSGHELAIMVGLTPEAARKRLSRCTSRLATEIRASVGHEGITGR